MNEHRRSRLRRLAVGTALVGASLAAAQSSPVTKNVNSPPRPPPAKVDAGTPADPVAKPVEPGPPVRMNSPGPQKPLPPLTVDAGTPAPKDDGPTINSPPPRKGK